MHKTLTIFRPKDASHLGLFSDANTKHLIDALEANGATFEEYRSFNDHCANLTAKSNVMFAGYRPVPRSVGADPETVRLALSGGVPISLYKRIILYLQRKECNILYPGSYNLCLLFYHHQYMDKQNATFNTIHPFMKRTELVKIKTNQSQTMEEVVLHLESELANNQIDLEDGDAKDVFISGDSEPVFCPKGFDRIALKTIAQRLKNRPENEKSFRLYIQNGFNRKAFMVIGLNDTQKLIIPQNLNLRGVMTKVRNVLREFCAAISVSHNNSRPIPLLAAALQLHKNRTGVYTWHVRQLSLYPDTISDRVADFKKGIWCDAWKYVTKALLKEGRKDRWLSYPTADCGAYRRDEAACNADVWCEWWRYPKSKRKGDKCYQAKRKKLIETLVTDFNENEKKLKRLNRHKLITLLQTHIEGKGVVHRGKGPTRRSANARAKPCMQMAMSECQECAQCEWVGCEELHSAHT